MSDLEVYRPPSASEFETLGRMANAIAAAKTVPAAYQNSPGTAMAAILTGREFGMGPMAAMRSIHMIEGKPSLSAETQYALVLRAGHKIRPVVVSSERVVVKGHRADDPDEEWTEIEWTLQDAQRAGVAGKDNWRKYPKAMLWARAVSQLVTVLFPDVTMGGVYTPDELGDDRPPAPTTTVETFDAEIVEDSPLPEWVSQEREQREAERERRTEASRVAALAEQERQRADEAPEPAEREPEQVATDPAPAADPVAQHAAEVGKTSSEPKPRRGSAAKPGGGTGNEQERGEDGTQPSGSRVAEVSEAAAPAPPALERNRPMELLCKALDLRALTAWLYLMREHKSQFDLKTMEDFLALDGDAAHKAEELLVAKFDKTEVPA